jgi:methylenetetrahydrofolate dehydrogenase (NADP+)/methenyltetrahydrofolate cyclohydrolase
MGNDGSSLHRDLPLRSVEIYAEVWDSLKQMLRLDGKIVSEARREALKPRIVRFLQKTGRKPHLVFVRVGNDPASEVYVKNKIKACESVGLQSSLILLPKETPQIALNETIKKLVNDQKIDGILVQLPLPKGLKEEEILEILTPEKDADGFTFQAMGNLWTGHSNIAPCTPAGVMSILEHYKIPVAGKSVVVVGRSNIVGKPMAHLLTTADATVTVCHSKTPDVSKFTKEADLVVVAAGKKHLLSKKDFKAGAVVIDVGIHGTGQGTGITGDVNMDGFEDYIQAATPVPGGVGPMTITTLLENTVSLAEKRAGL